MEEVRSLTGRLRARARAYLARRSPAENMFLALIPLTGAATGLAAVAIAHIIAFLQKLFWGSGQNLLDAAMQTSWNHRILVLTVGGVMVGLIGYLCKVETRGAGTAGLIQALALRGGAISLRQTVPRVWAGIFTVAAGGALGREGPMTQLGGALGSWAAWRCKLSSAQRRVLACSTAAAAIAAVYNAPIGGSLFAMEVLIGSFALEIFGPVVVASVISTLIFRSAMGDLPRFMIPEVLKEGYRLVSGWELLAYLGLGVLGGIVSVLFVKSLFWTEDLFKKARIPEPARPAIGFALVGILAVWYPHVLGNGYEPVNLALSDNLDLRLLLILPLVKLAATAFTFGAGGAGGLFMPTLMIGALLGGAFGTGLHHWLPDITAGPGAYALVGMAAVLAGTTYAPLTAIMMIFEQTDSYQIVLPLMFVCSISTVVARGFMSAPVHLQILQRRGVVLPKGPEGGVMQTLRVADVMHEDVEAVPAQAPFGVLAECFLKTRHQYVYVVDADRRFLGVVALHTIKEMFHRGEELKAIIAYDLVEENFEFVTPRDRLADTMDKFWRQNSERLPVLADSEHRQLVGWISKRDLIGIYSQEILNKPQLLAKFSIPEEEGERTAYVTLPPGFQIRTLLVPAPLAGRTLAELAPRSAYGVHVLQVTRLDPQTGRETVEMPGPNSRLAADDRLVVIGRAEGIAQLQEALGPSVEKPAS